ncbi:hypothetical protein [Salisediminibacterium selenitireducens]|uniref:Pilus assembly protein PilO n=1 Tax=Bacillus selenitireducens (strain ATCC 700615 / DSM 15326 / MLS10) TaxID=439292 RepID=D6XT23_BACIE|nr:hypothetical protein [Salisediminibacterium selenitireducens]ADH98959.1 hypothetical protein Bsel_1447 [[Bacillus] selenitireducens MLS10]
MNRRERVLLYIVFGLIALASFYGSYTLVTGPAIDERDRLERSVEAEEAQVDALEVQLLERQREFEAGDTNTVNAQRKMPVPPLTDQVLLGLNQAQELSGAVIQDIFISTEDVVEPLHLLTAEEDEAAGGQTAEDLIAESEGEAPPEETDPAEEAVENTALDGVHRQIFTLDVKVNAYERLAAFLNELEALDRIMNVEMIYFTGADEVQIFEGDSDIFFEVTVATYHYPGLDSLLDETPEPHYLPSPNRDQPFSD